MEPRWVHEKKKKNSRVSPCLLHLKILKQPLRATWSCGRVVIGVIVFVSIVIIVLADLNVENKTLVTVSRKITKVLRGGESNRFFVRSFVRLIVRSRRMEVESFVEQCKWRWKNKVMKRGRRSKEKELVGRSGTYIDFFKFRPPLIYSFFRYVMRITSFIIASCFICYKR
jgi:hypothetical protein